MSVIPKVIDMIKGNGYKMVTLDECLNIGDATKNKSPLKGAGGKPVSGDSLESLPKGGSPMPNAGGKSGNGDLGMMDPSGDNSDDIGSGKLGNSSKNGAASDIIPVLSSHKSLWIGLVILGLLL